MALPSAAPWGSPKHVVLCACETQDSEMQGRNRAHSQSAMGEDDDAADRGPPREGASTTCLGLPAQVNTEHAEQNQPDASSSIKIENTPAENRTHSVGLNTMGFQFAERQNYKNSVFNNDTDRSISVNTHHRMEREHRMFAFEEET